MKKLFFFAALVAFAVSNYSFTGTEFEGKVNFEISMDGSKMPPEAMTMFEGSELTIYIKAGKSRSEVKMGPSNYTTISDSKTNVSYMLMEMMGKKYKIKSEPAKTDKASEATVKYLDDTKDIAGYKCKKAEVSFKDNASEKQTTIIWYTEEISNQMGHDSRSAQFKDIKGMLLEYEMNAERGMKMKMTAKKVSKEPVPDSKFEIPADYKETTIEEMQKEMMKGGMQGGQH